MDARDDRGESLIELLIAMLIMSTAVVAVVAAMGTAVLVSAQNRLLTQAEVATRAYAEALSGSYVPCASTSTAAYLSPAGFSAPAGFTAGVVSVSYLNGSSFGAAGACDPASDARMQKVRLQVATNDGDQAAQIDVMLRKPCRNAGCA